MAVKNIEQSIILVSAIIACVSISAFASLVCIPKGIASSVIGLKTCALTAGTKIHKSIIKKKRIKHDEIILFAKAEVNGNNNWFK